MVDVKIEDTKIYLGKYIKAKQVRGKKKTGATLHFSNCLKIPQKYSL
jgi:hypothetical protein